MSIDLWTIGFEVVNFLVLVWLLERLLYRPVLGVIARRQAEIDRLHAADASAHKAVATEREKLEHEREALLAERARALEAAHALARDERARVEAEAREEMERLLRAGRSRLEHERADVAGALRRKSAEIGVAVARSLLALSTPPDGDGRFVEAVCERLRDLPENERARIAAGLDEQEVVEVITAESMAPGRQAHCRERIADILGHEVAMTFTTDASLIAGIEVHFPGLVLRHSWRDALAASEAALVEEAEQGPAPDERSDPDAR